MPFRTKRGCAIRTGTSGRFSSCSKTTSPKKQSVTPTCCEPTCCAPAEIGEGAEGHAQDDTTFCFSARGTQLVQSLGEAILNYKGRPGTSPLTARAAILPGGFHPVALRQLELAHISTAGLRSKSWDEFAKPGAPKMDFVFTVCDNAAKEVCPLWPGQPMTAHWGVPDPAVVTGTPEEIERAFRDAFTVLQRRIDLFLCLPLASLQSLATQKEIDKIGKQ